MSNEKDYEVGYRKPPRQSQFRKGESGNPKGRPKKASSPVPTGADSIDSIFSNEMSRLVTLTEGGKSQQVSFLAALVKSALNNATKSRLERKYLFDLSRELHRIDLEDRRARYDEWREIAAHHRRILESHRTRGTEPPPLYPHPDDLVFDPETLKVRCFGPMSAQEAPLYDAMRTLRDCLIVASELNGRGSQPLTVTADGQSACAFGVLAEILNTGMPRSYRWTVNDMFSARWKYHMLSLRELRSNYRRLRDAHADELVDLQRAGKLPRHFAALG